MTWDDLKTLREAGKRPVMALAVATTWTRQIQTMADAGAMVILHKPGEPLPVELLAGLRVWLFVGSCDRAQGLIRACNKRGVKPAEVASWCECGGFLDRHPVSCEVASLWAV